MLLYCLYSTETYALFTTIPHWCPGMTTGLAYVNTACKTRGKYSAMTDIVTVNHNKSDVSVLGHYGYYPALYAVCTSGSRGNLVFSYDLP